MTIKLWVLIVLAEFLSILIVFLVIELCELIQTSQKYPHLNLVVIIFFIKFLDKLF